MRKALILAAAIALPAGCGRPETDQTAAPAVEAGPAASAPAATADTGHLVLGCAAPFTPDATAATLAAAFGAENVIPETIDGPEGEKINVTAIYPKDPARRVEVYFKDEEARTGLTWTTVKEEASAWTGPGGIKMGDGIEKVEAANGGVFELSGFDWDYGGYVTNWKGGKLDEVAPGCRASVRFRRGPGNRDNSIAGEGGRASDLAAMRAAKPVVAEFGIRW